MSSENMNSAEWHKYLEELNSRQPYYIVVLDEGGVVGSARGYFADESEAIRKMMEFMGEVTESEEGIVGTGKIAKMENVTSGKKYGPYKIGEDGTLKFHGEIDCRSSADEGICQDGSDWDTYWHTCRDYYVGQCKVVLPQDNSATFPCC